LLILANQGHAIADAEKSLEDAIAQGKTQAVLNGTTYDISKLAQGLGIDVAPGSGVWKLSSVSAQPLMMPFVQQYQTIVQMGLLDNPIIQQQIDALSYQIAATGDAVSWNFNTLNSQGAPIDPDKFRSGTVQDFSFDLSATPISQSKPMTASVASNLNSAQICSIGSGQDSGKSCSTQ
jgi:hypothetical protein